MAIPIDRVLDKTRGPLGALQGAFRSLLYGDPRVDLMAQYRWPEAISYRLRYCDAVLGDSDLSILNEGSFVDTAFYLLVKGLNDNPEKQRGLVAKVARAAISEGTTLSVKSAISEEINTLRKTPVEVNGKKMTVMGPVAIEVVTDQLVKFGDQAIQEGKTPVLIAYSGMLAFRRLVAVSAKKGFDLYMAKIISPDDLSEPTYGLRIRPDGDVSFLYPTTPIPDNLILLDDVYNTGKGVRRVSEQLTKAGCSRLEYMCAITTFGSAKPN